MGNELIEPKVLQMKQVLLEFGELIGNFRVDLNSFSLAQESFSS